MLSRSLPARACSKPIFPTGSQGPQSPSTAGSASRSIRREWSSLRGTTVPSTALPGLRCATAPPPLTGSSPSPSTLVSSRHPTFPTPALAAPKPARRIIHSAMSVPVRPSSDRQCTATAPAAASQMSRKRSRAGRCCRRRRGRGGRCPRARTRRRRRCPGR